MNNQPKPQFLDVPVPKARKQRGASKATLAHRAKVHGLCVACGERLAGHTVEQMGSCANARS